MSFHFKVSIYQLFPPSQLLLFYFVILKIDDERPNAISLSLQFSTRLTLATLTHKWSFSFIEYLKLVAFGLATRPSHVTAL